MTKRLQLKRVLTLLGLLCLAFAGLGSRLVELQVLRHDELAAKAQQNTQREFWRRRAAVTFSTRTAICSPRAFL
jgi:cell division protein FtsI/penicillin-binding protein 2